MRNVLFDLAAAGGRSMTFAAAWPARRPRSSPIGIPTTPPNIVHMPVIVAKDLGLYKKYGIDVEIVVAR